MAAPFPDFTSSFVNHTHWIVILFVPELPHGPSPSLLLSDQIPDCHFRLHAEMHWTLSSFGVTMVTSPSGSVPDCISSEPNLVRNAGLGAPCATASTPFTSAPLRLWGRVPPDLLHATLPISSVQELVP